MFAFAPLDEFDDDSDDPFEGFNEASDSDDEVIDEPDEVLDNLGQISRWTRTLSKIREYRLWQRTKRHVAAWILGSSLAVLAILVVVGSFGDGNFTGAKTWWMFVGPLVGFILRVLFDASKEKIE